MTGQKISHYELLEKLGEGGMGVVYKARDLLLNRSAALKLLPPDSVISDDQRQRLIQEAQSASALNHPNIVTVYEVGQSESRDFIAMEFVQGRTLESLIGRKTLSAREALPYAIQIADALSAAHAAGIVHRDLKPGNVMVSESGRVKVLDFGLAKSSSPLDPNASNVTRTILAGPKTTEGTIVGTVSYMSPEQAEGKPVDYRSDIFSFGAVLYEILTGHRAFQGETAVSTLAAVLHIEPRQVPSGVDGVPRPLDRIVRRCLAKTPERRWQSIADVRMALEDVKQDLESGHPGVAAPVASRTSKRWMAIAAAAALIVALIAVVLWRSWPKETAVEQYSIRRLTSDNGASVTPAISQDGKLVAYASDRSGEGPVDIWVQQVAGGDPVRLTRDLGQCSDPAFSPDGSKIVFHSEAEGGGIYVISALGGTPRKVAQGASPQFSSDGTRISYLPFSAAPDGRNSIMLVPTMGGNSREVRAKHVVVSKPLWSQDGKSLLYLGAGKSASERDWFVVNENGDETAAGAAVKLAKLVPDGLFLRPSSWATDGVLFYAGTDESMNIYRLPFDATTKHAAGFPKTVTVAPGFNFHPSGSRDGDKIAFASGVNVTSNLWHVAVDAVSGKAAGEPMRITEGLENRVAPFPSADGNHLAYVWLGAGLSEARVRTIGTGKEVRLAEVSSSSSPVISEDGSKVAYYVGRGSSAIYEVAAHGGVPRQICAKCGRPTQWIQNGTKLLYDRAGPKKLDLAVLNVVTGESKLIVQDPQHQLYSPQVSPDGRLLCFTQVLDGRGRRIYVAPFAGEQSIDPKEWTVATEGANFDRQPVWSPKGSLLYFLSERDGYRCVWGQKIDPATRKPVGDSFAAHHFHQARYNLSDFGDTAEIGLSFAAGQMFFSLREIQSNIWLAERHSNKPQ